MNVAARIQELLSLRAMSRRDLAIASSLSEPYISQICNGKKKATLETLETICTALNVSLAEFFSGSPVVQSSYSASASKFAAEFDRLTPMQRSALQQVLNAFQESTHLYKEPKAFNFVQNSAMNDFVQPVHVLGDAAAGFPLYAVADPDETALVPKKYADASRFRVVRARGDSMEPRIHSGDIVVAAIDTPPEPGQIALVRLAGLADDEYVIKRVTLENGRYILRSDNPTYPPMTYASEDVRACEAVRDVFPRK